MNSPTPPFNFADRRLHDIAWCLFMAGIVVGAAIHHAIQGHYVAVAFAASGAIWLAALARREARAYETSLASERAALQPAATTTRVHYHGPRS